MRVAVAVIPLAAILLLLAGAASRPPDLSIAATEAGVRVVPGRWDRLLACRRALDLPWGDIIGIAAYPAVDVPREGLRLPGASAPGIRAGSFGTGPDRDFWDVRRGHRLLVIALRPGSEYRRLVLEVPDPDSVAADLLSHLAA
jgi:hypothetical protein